VKHPDRQAYMQTGYHTYRDSGSGYTVAATHTDAYTGGSGRYIQRGIHTYSNTYTHTYIHTYQEGQKTW